jgi:hypothetical protein
MNDHVIKKKVPTFVIRGHCFVHKTNLVVITFLDVPLEHQLESVLQILQPKEICKILKSC